MPLSATVEVSSRLNDDRWHSVLVERNRKQGRLLVDNSLKSTVSEPRGPVRSMRLTSKLVVGESPVRHWSGPLTALSLYRAQRARQVLKCDGRDLFTECGLC